MFTLQEMRELMNAASLRVIAERGVRVIIANGLNLDAGMTHLFSSTMIFGDYALQFQGSQQFFDTQFEKQQFEEAIMAKRNHDATTSAQPRFHQSAAEIQAYGTVNHALPLELEEPVRLEMTEQLNQLLADTITLRDLYKKSHWQVAGPTFYQLHLLYDKHFGEQVELVDSIAERIQLLGGVSIAMAADVAETTQIERPPRGREEVPVQLSRLLKAHQIIIRQARVLARRASTLGDDGTNDLVVSEVLRTNELQGWFLSEHLVNVPLVKAHSSAA